MKAKWIFLIIMAAAIVALITACNKSEDTTPGMGRLVIKVTDAPFPMDLIESATVTISKVEIRKVGDEDPDGNPFILLTDVPETFNLLELRNGVVAELLDKIGRAHV